MSDLSPTPAVPAAPAPSGVPAADSPADQHVESHQPGEQQPEPRPERTYTEAEHRKAIQEARGKAERRAERFALERARRELAEQELARLRGEPSNPSPRQPSRYQPQQGEPDPSQYDDPRVFNRDHNRWLASQQAAEREQLTAREQAQREIAERRESLNERMEAGREKYEDFDEIVSSRSAPITERMAQAIEESEVAHELAYELAHPRNRAEALRIANLPIREQARAMGAFEAKLVAKLTPARTTKAPPPIKPGGSPTGGSDPYDGSSTAAHVKAYLTRKKR